MGLRLKGKLMLDELKTSLEREHVIFRKYGFKEIEPGVKLTEGHRRMADMLEYLDEQISLLNFNVRVLLQKAKDDSDMLKSRLWVNVD